MTERTKKIKELISGQVDMGTFGLVELELLEIEKENESFRNHALAQRGEKLKDYNDFYDWHKKQGYVSFKRDDFEEYLNSLI